MEQPGDADVVVVGVDAGELGAGRGVEGVLVVLAGGDHEQEPAPPSPCELGGHADAGGQWRQPRRDVLGVPGGGCRLDQVEHAVDRPVHRDAVVHVGLAEAEAGMPGEAGQVGAPARGEVVDADHPVAAPQQRLAQVRPQEARSSRDHIPVRRRVISHAGHVTSGTRHDGCLSREAVVTNSAHPH